MPSLNISEYLCISLHIVTVLQSGPDQLRPFRLSFCVSLRLSARKYGSQMSSKSGAQSVLTELFRGGLYKVNQGRMVRQFTFFAIAILAAFGCITLARGPLMAQGRAVQVGLPLFLWAAAALLAFRLVNLSAFADFLISVESELLRVTWPGKQEVVQATVVVVTTMVGLGAFLFLIDLVWTWTFSVIGFNELLG